MSLPKLIITDIDGVWTDGSMYYSESGDELKRFHTSDGAGVYYARLNNIPVAIMTGEDTIIVKSRAKKLNVDYVFQGVKDKVKVAKEICEQLGIELKDCAFIGDDLNDYHLLKQVGISACPSNAQVQIKEIVDKVFDTQGGSGVFREFVAWILKEESLYEETIQKYLK